MRGCAAHWRASWCARVARTRAWAFSFSRTWVSARSARVYASWSRSPQICRARAESRSMAGRSAGRSAPASTRRVMARRRRWRGESSSNCSSASCRARWVSPRRRFAAAASVRQGTIIGKIDGPPPHQLPALLELGQRRLGAVQRQVEAPAGLQIRQAVRRAEHRGRYRDLEMLGRLVVPALGRDRLDQAGQGAADGHTPAPVRDDGERGPGPRLGLAQVTLAAEDEGPQRGEDGDPHGRAAQLLPPGVAVHTRPRPCRGSRPR